MRALVLGCICVGVAVGGIACRTTTVEEYQAPVPSTPGIPEDPHRIPEQPDITPELWDAMSEARTSAFAVRC
jgi:hypothetical protein